MFYVRDFLMGDETQVYQLFYETVHEINRRDYSADQLNIWAPKTPDLDKWQKNLSKNHTLIAIDSKRELIVGFLDMEKNGYLDHLYVHKDYQNQGIAKLLVQEVERHARTLGLKKLFSDVSITARPVMEKMGYVVLAQKTKEKDGVVFVQYAMEKELK